MRLIREKKSVIYQFRDKNNRFLNRSLHCEKPETT